MTADVDTTETSDSRTGAAEGTVESGDEGGEGELEETPVQVLGAVMGFGMLFIPVGAVLLGYAMTGIHAAAITDTATLLTGEFIVSALAVAAFGLSVVGGLDYYRQRSLSQPMLYLGIASLIGVHIGYSVLGDPGIIVRTVSLVIGAPLTLFAVGAFGASVERFAREHK